MAKANGGVNAALRVFSKSEKQPQILRLLPSGAADGNSSE